MTQLDRFFVVIENDFVCRFCRFLEDRLVVLILLYVQLLLDIEVVRNCIIKYKVFLSLSLDYRLSKNVKKHCYLFQYILIAVRESKVPLN